MGLGRVSCKFEGIQGNRVLLRRCWQGVEVAERLGILMNLFFFKFFLIVYF